MTMQPADETELAEMIKDAAGPLKVMGGGSRPIGNPVDGTVLDMTGLKGVRLYEPGSLTLVAAAGTRLAEITTLLDRENQRLAFEPMDHRGLLNSNGQSTIGGVVAANISGPRRIQAGACRDFLLGVRFVDGTGQIVKNGGRVMKNVTGYDLVKLMAGSFGTLGVLTELSLKVLPKAETQATLRLQGLDDVRAIAALSAALGSPFDVTGAAHLPGQHSLIRLEGFGASVAYRAERLSTLLASFGDVEIISDVAESAAIWQGIRDVSAFQQAAGDVWRISVKPSDGPGVGQRLAAVSGQVVYDWGGGLVWARVAQGTDLRSHLTGIKGHARIERASDETRKRLGAVAAENPVAGALAQNLRRKFDPRQILNPGLMG